MDEIDHYLEHVMEKIAELGWAVQVVKGHEVCIDGKHIIEPQFAYSVGLTARQQAEIIIVGNFAPKLTASVINSAIRSSEKYGDVYTDGCVSDRVLQNMPVVFRSVTDECAMRIALVAKRLYGSVRLVQMFLPDKHGHFPWHTDCEEGFNEQATLQYVSPAPGLH